MKEKQNTYVYIVEWRQAVKWNRSNVSKSTFYSYAIGKIFNSITAMYHNLSHTFIHFRIFLVSLKCSSWIIIPSRFRFALQYCLLKGRISLQIFFLILQKKLSKYLHTFQRYLTNILAQLDLDALEEFCESRIWPDFLLQCHVFLWSKLFVPEIRHIFYMLVLYMIIHPMSTEYKEKQMIWSSYDVNRMITIIS